MSVKYLGVFSATFMGCYLGIVLAWSSYAFLFQVYDGEMDRILLRIAPICGLLGGGLATASVSMYERFAVISGREKSQR
jgi:hypothetical protein